MTKRILVIDDREELLALLRMILEDERYQVSVLREGQGAIERIRADQPDLVILDLRLEDASGVDVLQSLRAHTGTADIPVIVYTAAVIEAEAVNRLISRKRPATATSSSCRSRSIWTPCSTAYSRCWAPPSWGLPVGASTGGAGAWQERAWPKGAWYSRGANRAAGDSSSG